MPPRRGCGDRGAGRARRRTRRQLDPHGLCRGRDWEYAQLADQIYDLACLSIYYPGLQRRGGELLDAAGITDVNATVRLRLHMELFDSLNRLWQRAQALQHA